MSIGAAIRLSVRWASIRAFVVNNHPFASLDQEDRKQAYAEARGTWITVGFALALGVFAGLIFWGVI